jgi:type I restriction enzyme S subunit
VIIIGDVMTNGWLEIPIGKVLKRADRFEKKDDLRTYHFAGTYSYARGIFAGTIKEGSTFGLDKIQRIKKDDFIYCKIMAWEGAFGIAPEKVDNCVMSGAFVAYEVDQTQIYPKFLDYYFKQEPVWKSIGSQSAGTNVRRRSLHPDHFEKATIPFPPLDEQRRIVERVEALAIRIAKAQSLREEIKEETELLLAAELKKLRYELLSSKFTKNKLGDITQVTAGGTPSRDNPSYWKGKIPWIRTGELLDGDIYSSGEHITEDGLKNSSAKLFPKETILIALYGQGQTRGRTGRLMIEATTNQACCAILPIPDLLEPRFTQYWLRSLYYEMRETSHGGAQPNWNGAMIKNIEISIPPLDEQRCIVAYLDGVQARLASLRELQSATGEELSALLPSVLDRAFKGEL